MVTRASRDPEAKPKRARKRVPASAAAPEDATVPEDARYLVIDGRRWRRSDPSIPEAFRAELVNELTSARRAVLTAQRDSSRRDEAHARARVHDAKLALGERGHAYWDAPDEAAQRTRAAAAIRALLRHRGPAKTICPSDVARTIGGASWRSLMPLVREVASELAGKGELLIQQRGRTIEAPSAQGPIRLALNLGDGIR